VRRAGSSLPHGFGKACRQIVPYLMSFEQGRRERPY
jgi:hypothetical protein